MLYTYIKIGFRNLTKNRFFSFINLIGMTLGLSCFILIAFYIQNELSYDMQHENADRIYRVSQIQSGNEFQGTDRFAVAPRPLAPTLKAQFPEVEAATTLTLDETLLKIKDQPFYAQGLFSDPYLFDVFTYPLIVGMAKEALKDPKSVIITTSLAKKYFGEASPLGKTILLEQDRLLTVKGVVEDLPKNQHFSFDYITSYENYRYYDESSSWSSNNYHAYIVLPEGYDYHLLNEKMDALDVYTTPAYAQFPFTAEYFLQPLKEIRLYSNINFELGPVSDIKYIYLAASIAIIILLLAFINYTNLAIARTSYRSKEVGLQKVLGAKKRQVINQFMAESFLLTSCSFILALALAFLFLPGFNALIGSEIPLSFDDKAPVVFIIIVIGIVLGVLSGIYPALLSSAINPAKALKGKWLNSKTGISLRNTLVVGQFAASVVLAISSIVVYQQLNYVNKKKLGYNKDQIVYVHYKQTDFYAKNNVIKEALLQHPQIKKVTLTNNIPTNTEDQTIIDQWEGNTGDQNIQIYRNYVDPDYLDVFEMELEAGRNFSSQFPTDSTESILLNEAAVKKLGWSTAVGKTFGGRKVIGMVKDFHFQPFKLKIEPVVIGFRSKLRSYYSNYIAIKLELNDLENTLNHVKGVLNTHIPGIPFDQRFMNESYDQLYRTEKQFGQVFNTFTLVALFIACIGLLGLVTQKVSERSKEIGVRKVLGASIANIVLLFTKDFMRLVLLAVIIAIPIGWWGMEKWLQDFAYRIEMNWTVFVLAALLGFGVAFITVGAQTLTTANKNPIQTLREE